VSLELEGVAARTADAWVVAARAAKAKEHIASWSTSFNCHGRL